MPVLRGIPPHRKLRIPSTFELASPERPDPLTERRAPGVQPLRPVGEQTRDRLREAARLRGASADCHPDRPAFARGKCQACYRRDYRAGRKPVTAADYALAYENQGGACWICGTPARRLCVDHDHSTGEFRGLLCRACNFMIGMALDRPDILRRAASYLEQGKTVQGVLKT